MCVCVPGSRPLIHGKFSLAYRVAATRPCEGQVAEILQSNNRAGRQARGWGRRRGTMNDRHLCFPLGTESRFLVVAKVRYVVCSSN